MYNNVKHIQYISKTGEMLYTKFSIYVSGYRNEPDAIILKVDENEFCYEKILDIYYDVYQKNSTVYQIFCENRLDEEDEDDCEYGGLIIRKIYWDEWDAKVKQKLLRGISKIEKAEYKKKLFDEGPKIEESILYIAEKDSKKLVEFIKQNDIWLKKGILFNELTANSPKTKWHGYYLHRIYDWGYIQYDWLGGMSTEGENYIELLEDLLEEYLSDYKERFDYNLYLDCMILPDCYKHSAWGDFNDIPESAKFIKYQ